MRTYELMVVLDPRSSEDETTGLIGDIQSLVEDKGAEVIKLDIWGRRKLAYEIQKLKEGHYALFYLSTEDGSHGLAEVEQRLKQHDLVLRYMLIRTDDDLRRAGLPLPTADEEEATEAASTEAASAEAKSTEAAPAGATATESAETESEVSSEVSKEAAAESGDDTGDDSGEEE